MQAFKKRIFGKETTIAQQGNFGFTSVGITACGLPATVFIYRNVLYGNFFEATILATDEELTVLAPAGYYSEYSSEDDGIISRYWDGTAFVGMPDVCA